jgi:hypothetical protein
MPKMKGMIAEKEWQDLRIDPATHFAVALNQDNYLLHQGDLYIFSDYFELAGNPTPGSKDILFKYPVLPSDGEWYVRWTTAGTEAYTLHIFVNPVVSVMGSPLTLVNKRILSGKTSEVEMYEDPTIDTPGVNTSNTAGGPWQTTSGVFGAGPILIPAGLKVHAQIQNQSVRPNRVDVIFEVAPHPKRNEILNP